MKGFSFYNAFNLVIRSNFRIPFLINDHKDDRKFDIEFNYDSSLSKPKNSKRTLSSEYAYESSEDLGYFLISNGEKIDFNINLNMGSKKFTVYTMDLTKKYIEINSDYRS